MRFPFRSKASSSPAYRADIDGLRAIAVLAVVLFHAKVPGFGGGYVGVDIFFVISGYLITQVIETEMDQGKFSFLGFYERRVRRIFPALVVVLLATTAMGVFAFPQQQLAEFGKSLLAVSGFVSNLFFRTTSRNNGYFASGSGDQFLLHTWSLSVEEQFYLFFPVLLLLLHRFGRRAKQGLILVLGVASYVASVHGVRTQPVAAFYLLPGRAWELLLGALIAYKVFPPLRHSASRTVAGAVGLGLMVWSITTYTDGTPFPGAAALAPVAGAALLIYAGEGGTSWTRAVMSLPPIVFVGVISYSLYLWHWPLIALTKWYWAPYALPWQKQMPAVAASILLAMCTYVFVETPFRKRKSAGEHRHPAVRWGLAVNGMLALLGVMLIATHGLPQRFNAAKAKGMAANYERKKEFFQPDACGNFGSPGEQFDHPQFCSPEHKSENILFWGDSHTGQLWPLLNRMQSDGDLGQRGVVFAVSMGCTFGPALTTAGSGAHCERFAEKAMQRAEQSDIDTVFVTFSPWWTLAPLACVPQGNACGTPLAGDQAWKLYLTAMEKDIRTLEADGKHVILTVPFPIYDRILPDLAIRNIALGHFPELQLYPRELIPPSELADTRALAARTGATLYDPRAVLCPHDGQCEYLRDGISMYSDQSHLATTELEQLRSGLREAVAAADGHVPQNRHVP